MTKTTYAFAFVAVVAAAFGLRVAVAARFVGLDAPPKFDANPDQVDYENLAWRLASGRGYVDDRDVPTSYRPPGTAFVLAPIYALCGRSWACGRVWFCFLSAAACAATAWLALPFLGRGGSLLAAAAVALYPGSFYYSMHFLSEGPFGFFLAASLAMALHRGRERRSALWDVVSGLSLGMAILLRPSILPLVPGQVVLALFAGPERWTWVRRALVQGVCAAAVVAPWVVRNGREVGEWGIATVGAGTFWGAHNERTFTDPNWAGFWIDPNELADAEHPTSSDERERTARFWKYGKDAAREHATRLPYLTAMKVYRLLTPFEATANRTAYWAFALGWLVAAPVTLWGLWRMLRTRRAEALVLFGPLGATLAAAVIFYGCIRFRDAVAPAFLTLATAGVVRLRPPDAPA